VTENQHFLNHLRLLSTRSGSIRLAIQTTLT
jgi:hypothetical protein